MLEVLPKIAKMQASYILGKPLANPLNLTISVSYRCNSRCKTCNVWQRPNDDFTLEEYDKTFASIGRDAYWFTFSGGEPTLRKDLPEMVEAAYRHCRPGIINIPTNGIQDKIIPSRIERVLQAAPTSDVIVNLSLDGVGENHRCGRRFLASYRRRRLFRRTGPTLVLRAKVAARRHADRNVLYCALRGGVQRGSLGGEIGPCGRPA